MYYTSYYNLITLTIVTKVANKNNFYGIIYLYTLFQSNWAIPSYYYIYGATAKYIISLKNYV